MLNYREFANRLRNKELKRELSELDVEELGRLREPPPHLWLRNSICDVFTGSSAS